MVEAFFIADKWYIMAGARTERFIVAEFETVLC